jgi:hypothetical protein
MIDYTPTNKVMIEVIDPSLRETNESCYTHTSDEVVSMSLHYSRVGVSFAELSLQCPPRGRREVYANEDTFLPRGELLIAVPPTASRESLLQYRGEVYVASMRLEE